MTKHTNDIDPELLKMILASNSSKKEGTISINPTTALIGVVGVLVVLFQLFLGFGMWAIQDKVQKFDSYDQRIVTIEKNLATLDLVRDKVDTITVKFDELAKNGFSEEKFADKTKPILDTLTRIENRLVEREADQKDYEKRLNEIEYEVEIIKRTK